MSSLGHSRFVEILQAYATYTLELEGIPPLNDEEFRRKLRMTLKNRHFKKIHVGEEEAIEVIQWLCKQILESTNS